MRDLIIGVLYVCGYIAFLLLFVTSDRPLSRRVWLRSLAWPVIVVVIFSGLAGLDASEWIRDRLDSPLRSPSR